jgi:hypothetical protein
MYLFYVELLPFALLMSFVSNKGDHTCTLYLPFIVGEREAYWQLNNTILSVIVRTFFKRNNVCLIETCVETKFWIAIFINFYQF